MDNLIKELTELIKIEKDELIGNAQEMIEMKGAELSGYDDGLDLLESFDPSGDYENQAYECGYIRGLEACFNFIKIITTG